MTQLNPHIYRKILKDQPCQAVGCNKTFDGIKTKKHCSPSCRQKAYLARKKLKQQLETT